jgi:hypothetical protein
MKLFDGPLLVIKNGVQGTVFKSSKNYGICSAIRKFLDYPEKMFEANKVLRLFIETLALHSKVLRSSGKTCSTIKKSLGFTGKNH